MGDGKSESQKMREKSIQELYVLSMGEYEWDKGVPEDGQPPADLKFKKAMSNQMINRCDGLRTVCLLLNRKIHEMATAEIKSLHNANIGLELELRMVCNIMINFLIYNNDDESMIRDFTNLDNLMEETCFKAIQLSLDTAFVPARKIILIFHIYMRYLFGEKVESPEHKAFYSNLKYLSQYIDFHNFEKTPRHLLKTDSPVELFYKRNMNKQHPIPNIIVVGILRVLLSTCPNTKKNKTGGVQIHREWSSSLKLYLLNKEWFDQEGFKSGIFQHTTVDGEYQRLAA